MCPQALSSPSPRITPLSGAHTGLSYVIPVSQAGQSQDPQRPQGDFLIRIFFPLPVCAVPYHLRALVSGQVPRLLHDRPDGGLV